MNVIIFASLTEFNTESKILHDISVGFLSQHITNENKQFLDRLLQKLNAFNTSPNISFDINTTRNGCHEAKSGYYPKDKLVSLL